VTSLYAGSVFGVLTFVTDLARGYGAIAATAAGVFGGIFFGLVMGLVNRRLAERVRRQVGDVRRSDERVISKAARRGPVPEDPELRTAALRLAQLRAEQAHRWDRLSSLFFFAMTALSVYLAVSDGAGWLMATAGFAAVAVAAMREPRRLDRRVDELRGGGQSA
jgi:hypothetical protein